MVLIFFFLRVEGVDVESAARQMRKDDGVAMASKILVRALLVWELK